jgi:hypothetical protein
MKYDSVKPSHTDEKAYVMGEFKRTLTVYNGADVVIKTPNNEKSFKIESSQWSTHARVTTKFAEQFEKVKKAAKKSNLETPSYILPGGATLSLTTPKAKLNSVLAITYQCVLEGNGKTQVTVTDGESTLLDRAQTIEFHKKFASKVLSEVSQISVAQYISIGVTLSRPSTRVDFDSDVTVDTDGTKITISSDKKYYFNKWQNAKLNVEAETYDPVAHVFRADPEGNIYMDDNIILTKGQKESALAEGSTAYTINKYTGVVDQLVANLQRNSGNDTEAGWASDDGKWYNEAFDGITVLVQTTEIHLGYWNEAERTTVSDPKLMQKQTDQSDMGTKFLTSQYRTYSENDLHASFTSGFHESPTSSTVKTQSTKSFTILSNSGKLDEKDITGIYQSDLFYIPNITTQDLN